WRDCNFQLYTHWLKRRCFHWARYAGSDYKPVGGDLVHFWGLAILALGVSQLADFVSAFFPRPLG
ncbi:MAG TPA: hypothetical protein VGE41_08605, partial [Verrucomicrobiae bacterium]